MHLRYVIQIYLKHPRNYDTEMRFILTRIKSQSLRIEKYNGDPDSK